MRLRNDAGDRLEAVASNQGARQTEAARFVVGQNGEELRDTGSLFWRRVEREVRRNPLTF